MDETQRLDLDDEEETSFNRDKPVGNLHMFAGIHGPAQDFPIYRGKNLIGRHASCDITLPAQSVSKKHAILDVTGNCHTICDSGSLNKTRRGKVALAPNVRYALSDGDFLLFADVACRYTIPVNVEAETTGVVESEDDSMLVPATQGALAIEKTPGAAIRRIARGVVLARDSGDEEEQTPWNEGGSGSFKDSHKTSGPGTICPPEADTVVPESDEEIDTSTSEVRPPSLNVSCDSDTDTSRKSSFVPSSQNISTPLVLKNQSKHDERTWTAMDTSREESSKTTCAENKLRLGMEENREYEQAVESTSAGSVTVPCVEVAGAVDENTKKEQTFEKMLEDDTLTKPSVAESDENIVSSKIETAQEAPCELNSDVSAKLKEDDNNREEDKTTSEAKTSVLQSCKTNEGGSSHAVFHMDSDTDDDDEAATNGSHIEKSRSREVADTIDSEKKASPPLLHGNEGDIDADVESDKNVVKLKRDHEEEKKREELGKTEVATGLAIDSDTDDEDVDIPKPVEINAAQDLTSKAEEKKEGFYLDSDTDVEEDVSTAEVKEAQPEPSKAAVKEVTAAFNLDSDTDVEEEADVSIQDAAHKPQVSSNESTNVQEVSGVDSDTDVEEETDVSIQDTTHEPQISSTESTNVQEAKGAGSDNDVEDDQIPNVNLEKTSTDDDPKTAVVTAALHVDSDTDVDDDDEGLPVTPRTVDASESSTNADGAKQVISLNSDTDVEESGGSSIVPRPEDEGNTSAVQKKADVDELKSSVSSVIEISGISTEETQNVSAEISTEEDETQKSESESIDLEMMPTQCYLEPQEESDPAEEEEEATQAYVFSSTWAEPDPFKRPADPISVLQISSVTLDTSEDEIDELEIAETQPFCTEAEMVGPSVQETPEPVERSVDKTSSEEESEKETQQVSHETLFSDATQPVSQCLSTKPAEDTGTWLHLKRDVPAAVWIKSLQQEENTEDVGEAGETTKDATQADEQSLKLELEATQLYVEEEKPPETQTPPAANERKGLKVPEEAAEQLEQPFSDATQAKDDDATQTIDIDATKDEDSTQAIDNEATETKDDDATQAKDDNATQTIDINAAETKEKDATQAIDNATETKGDDATQAIDNDATQAIDNATETKGDDATQAIDNDATETKDDDATQGIDNNATETKDDATQAIDNDATETKDKDATQAIDNDATETKGDDATLAIDNDAIETKDKDATQAIDNDAIETKDDDAIQAVDNAATQAKDDASQACSMSGDDAVQVTSVNDPSVSSTELPDERKEKPSSRRGLSRSKKKKEPAQNVLVLSETEKLPDTAPAEEPGEPSAVEPETEIKEVQEEKEVKRRGGRRTAASQDTTNEEAVTSRKRTSKKSSEDEPSGINEPRGKKQVTRKTAKKEGNEELKEEHSNTVEVTSEVTQSDKKGRVVKPTSAEAGDQASVENKEIVSTEPSKSPIVVEGEDLIEPNDSGAKSDSLKKPARNKRRVATRLKKADAEEAVNPGDVDNENSLESQEETQGRKATRKSRVKAPEPESDKDEATTEDYKKVEDVSPAEPVSENEKSRRTRRSLKEESKEESQEVQEGKGKSRRSASIKDIEPKNKDKVQVNEDKPASNNMAKRTRNNSKQETSKTEQEVKENAIIEDNEAVRKSRRTQKNQKEEKTEDSIASQEISSSDANTTRKSRRGQRVEDSVTKEEIIKETTSRRTRRHSKEGDDVKVVQDQTKKSRRTRKNSDEANPEDTLEESLAAEDKEEAAGKKNTRKNKKQVKEDQKKGAGDEESQPSEEKYKRSPRTRAKAADDSQGEEVKKGLEESPKVSPQEKSKPGRGRPAAKKEDLPQLSTPVASRKRGQTTKTEGEVKRKKSDDGEEKPEDPVVIETPKSRRGRPRKLLPETENTQTEKEISPPDPSPSRSTRQRPSSASSNPQEARTPRRTNRTSTAATSPYPAQSGSAPKILFTGVVDTAGEETIRSLGGDIAESVFDCTHLVTDRVRRTVKFLCALARGIPIVTLDWIDKCKKSGCFLSPNGFLVHDKEQEKNFSFVLSESLQKARKRPLFEGYEIHVTQQVKPEPDHMKDIIRCSGATFLPKMPRSFKEKCIVVSCPEDAARCKSVPASVPITSAEFILSGILRQEVNPTAYLLNPTAQDAGPTPAKRRR
ncbi:mediator of DNA damage checkpoint protein 1 isoform X2 [Engystomops pustulosus]